MNVIEIRDEAQLAALREPWNALLAGSAANTIFLTWEWVTAWWSAYGNPGDLRILVAVDGSGPPLGIAPLRLQRVRRYGRLYQKLSFIGDGSADSDYLDFIVAAGQERMVLQGFWKYLRNVFANGVLLEINEIPETSPNLPILLELASSDGMVVATADVPCGTVALPSDWQEYLKKLAPRFRTKIRSVLRNLQVRDDVRLRFCDNPRELAVLLPSLYELHGQRWAKEAKPGVFRWERKRLFYESLSPVLLDRGWLCFSALEWRGRVLACQYGFVYAGRYFQLQEGYDPSCEHWNVGVGLRAWSIQELVKRGISEYDFLGGIGRHKSDWGAETKLSKRIVLGKPSAASVLFCRGPEWIARARQSVKRLLPERWIARRDARWERRRRAAFEHAAPPNGDWQRRTLSACYYYSPLPALLRPIRNRYRLQISSDRGAKLRLHKRRQASVRILYYHRVNDERDPFFPAMSAAKFEEEIRVISRNYRVVSMGEALKRLAEDGPAEPVVAITFDDGYEDNCRIAYPILQRYAIPATIFLTTGSIDSREPLWFERLAQAVKTSPHASVDMELDVPRRLLLRSERDRLSANDHIYAFLRGLDDTERRDRLCEILSLLESVDTGERAGKMLTWDQVRWLKMRGIDFGGHTVTHPFVSRLRPEEASWEAAECKRRIEEELQEPVDHFAYPSGREGDFSPWNKQVILEAGYRAAVSTLWGVNYPGTDRMELRRGQPWEAHRAVFAAKLDWYQWIDS